MGMWSAMLSHLFIKPPEEVNSDRKIVGYEYAFNNETYQFAGVTPTDDYNLVADIDTNSLENNFNIFNIRFLDDTGMWSPMLSKIFIKLPETDILIDNQLVSYEYWFDHDITNKKSIALDPTVPDLLVAELDMKHIWRGEHKMHSQYKDLYGKYSSIITDTIVKIPFPVAHFEMSEIAICVGETINFTNTSVDYDTVLWNFDDGETSTDIDAAHTFTEAGEHEVSLSIFETATGLEDTFIQSILVAGYPINTVSASTTYPACFGEVVNLTADDPDANYLWSTGETTQSIAITEAGTYSVALSHESTPNCPILSDDIEVSFLSELTNTVSITGDNPTCFGDTVTLEADETDNVSYLWSTGETTQSIEVGVAGDYSVEITSTINTNCTTSSAVESIAFYDEIDTTITLETYPLLLSASQTAATYQWINCDTSEPIDGATASTYEPTVNGNYAVEITLNACMVSSDCVTVSTVAITDNAIKELVQLYPNPVQEVLVVATQVPVFIQIYNSNGQIIKELTLNVGERTIDLKDLSSGLYLTKLNVLSGEWQNQFTTVRVVKE